MEFIVMPVEVVMPVEAKTEGACDTINVCGIVF